MTKKGEREKKGFVLIQVFYTLGFNTSFPFISFALGTSFTFVNSLAVSTLRLFVTF